MTRFGPAEREALHDVVIIGGGVIGLAVAFRAREHGMTVAVVERDAVGSTPPAASTVAAGMLAPVAEADPGEPELLKLGLRSAARWPDFAADVEAASGLPVGFRRTGTLVVARDRDEAEHVQRELELRDRLGLHVERLLPSQARRLEPALAPHVRLAFHAADDHAVDPVALVAALAEACRRAGVELREGTPVARVEPGAVVLADGGRLACGQAVLAAGAWSGGIDGVPPLPVRPVKGVVLRLSGPPLLEHVVRAEGAYLVPREDGRIVLGATAEERGFDASVQAVAVHDLLRDAAEVVPGVLELRLDAALAGFRPGTPDNAPLLGAVAGHLVAACGHHRNGILLAAATADLVVAELAGAPEAHPFSPHRFEVLAA